MAELKGKLADCRIIDIAGRTSETVVFGATVVLIEQEAQARNNVRSWVRMRRTLSFPVFRYSHRRSAGPSSASGSGTSWK
ncbi:MAG: hypothetical protein MRJ92_09835 [Nitrospira sp.]|nr:hypothetical protein [Nitrospira sp.]